jgi:hypothetical protein
VSGVDDAQYFFIYPVGLIARTAIELALAAYALVWCARHRWNDRWADLGALAAMCWTVVGVVLLTAYVLGRGGGSSLTDWWTRHSDTLEWIRFASAGVVVVALTRIRRGVPASP